VPRISVIIVNWNNKVKLEQCLKSLEGQTFRDFEVIVVDNGSTDGSVEFVKRNFPTFVRLVENTGNLGFATGNNIGIERAEGEYILTLNNDTRMESGCMKKLVNVADASGMDTGMWAPKILSMEPPHLIDSVGGLLLTMDGIGKGRGRLTPDDGRFDGLREVLIPSACAGLYRRTMLEETGLFDDDFFAYCEDSDLGLRARLMGWKAQSVPGAVVYHEYSSTGGVYSPLKAFLVERNHFWVVMKNFPLRLLALLPFYSLWRYNAQVYGLIFGRGAGGRFIEKANPAGLLFALIKSYIYVILKLPAIFKKRRSIQKRRKLSSGQFIRILKAHNIRIKDLVLMD
jgi:GT2 family glycosyltransferase